MEIRDFFSTLDVSSSALDTYKTQLSLTAENIANATTTRTKEGTAYKRKLLVKKSNQTPGAFARKLNRSRIKLRTSSADHIERPIYETNSERANRLVELEQEVVEQAEFRRMYEPQHPDADDDGFVNFPDINVVAEMLELITASRAYEANITVMNAVKSMAKRALEI